MKLKEIIKAAAILVADEKTAKSIASSTYSSDSDTVARVNLFVDLANLVINELSSSYVPMKIKENKVATDGKIFYSSLKYNPLKILGVYDKLGNKLSFEIRPEYLITERGNVTVVYAYTPKSVGLNEEVGYGERDVSVAVLAYGVAAEFCLTQGRIDEAVTWRKRYSSGVEGFCMPENKRIKRRGWL